MTTTIVVVIFVPADSALDGHLAHVDEERARMMWQRNAAAGRHGMPGSHSPRGPGSDGATMRVEVEAYRAGYADGYVDCATMRSANARPPSTP